MWVDFHWHARDEEQAAQETIVHSLEVAHACGLDAIAAMPNLKKPLTTLERCLQYLSLADECKLPIKFFVHIGLTPDIEQVKRAVEATQKDERIIGMKAYFGRSTGNLSILDEEEQLKVFETLAREGYKGVLVGHCEDEKEMNDTLYDYLKPKTWSKLCRPERVEISSFLKIKHMAETARFQGRLHVAHVSTCKVVDEIYSYEGGLNLSCGVTPHHIFFDDSYLEGKDGAFYKCNPPLRKRKTQEGLLQRLIEGKIPIVESDHAPHLEYAKRSENPPSGISSGTSWPFVIQELQRRAMSEERLYHSCFQNACALYGVNVDRSIRDPDFVKLIKLQGDYSFDEFWRMKK